MNVLYVIVSQKYLLNWTEKGVSKINWPVKKNENQSIFFSVLKVNYT